MEQGCGGLTDGVPAEHRVRGNTGEAAAGRVYGDDPELVHGALYQPGDVPVVPQRQRSDWLAADPGPALGGGLLLLNEVAGN